VEEDYRLGELDVTVSNFLAATIDRFIDDVVLRTDTDPVKHMRLAALQHCCPLLGAQMIASWQARAAVYPDELVSALVAQSLSPEVLSGWAAREALASRGDLADTVLLAEAHTHADISPFRETLSERRRAIDPPSPDQ
jgi:hypothetical protein